MIQEDIARFLVIHITSDKTANTHLPIVCTFIAVAYPNNQFACFASQIMISMNIIIMEHIATIPLIFAVQTPTKLMWLQVIGEAMVF